MSEIENFIKSKNFEIHVVKEEDYFDFIIEYDKDLENQVLSDRYRDHVFVLDREKESIIAYTCLMKDYDFPHDSLDSAMTLSTIYVNSNYRNQGISKQLIESTLEHVKQEEKILKRTKPSTDGKNYSFNRITEVSKKIDLPTIPYNLSFIYEMLSKNNFLKNKSINQKLELFEETSNKLLDKIKEKNKNVKTLSDISDMDKNELKKILNIQTYKKRKSPR